MRAGSTDAETGTGPSVAWSVDFSKLLVSTRREKKIPMTFFGQRVLRFELTYASKATDFELDSPRIRSVFEHSASIGPDRERQPVELRAPPQRDGVEGEPSLADCREHRCIA